MDFLCFTVSEFQSLIGFVISMAEQSCSPHRRHECDNVREGERERERKREREREREIEKERERQETMDNIGAGCSHHDSQEAE
jgi:hypothetical protein